MLSIITRHLDQSGMKLRKWQNIDSFCAFTGAPITVGVKLSDVIKKTFTDQAFIRYPSEYVSLEIAMLLETTVPAEKGYNCLRNYSFLATEKELLLLKREDILSHILSPPRDFYYFCVTYSNKKHIAFKAIPNNYRVLVITTDKGNVRIDYDALDIFLPIIQNWYTILPSETGKATPRTYFSKAQILGESIPNFNQIKAYGLDRFEEENNLLDKIRKSALFELIVFVLNKKGLIY